MLVTICIPTIMKTVDGITVSVGDGTVIIPGTPTDGTVHIITAVGTALGTTIPGILHIITVAGTAPGITVDGILRGIIAAGTALGTMADGIAHIIMATDTAADITAVIMTAITTDITLT